MTKKDGYTLRTYGIPYEIPIKGWRREIFGLVEEYKSRELKNFPFEKLQTIRSEPDLDKGI